MKFSPAGMQCDIQSKEGGCWGGAELDDPLLVKTSFLRSPVTDWFKGHKESRNRLV